MTQPDGDPNTLDALLVRSTASDRVLSRQLSNSWSDAEQAELESWLAESPANRIAYWRMEAAWKQAERLSALGKPHAGARTDGRRRNMGKIVGAFAATVAVAIVGTLSLSGSKTPSGKVYTTPVGGRLTLALKDGSRIELNTNTTLRIPAGDARHAVLEKGEAYFQIKHDAEHPFEVAAGGNRIVDLGTKFSVHAGTGRVEVALIEGSARVESANPAESANGVILKPGDVAVVTSDSLVVAREPVTALADGLAWRNDMLAFKYTTLAEAAAEFNRYNNTKIIVADPRAAKLTIYGNFPTRDVAGFADAAQVSLKLQVKKRNGEIVISR